MANKKKLYFLIPVAQLGYFSSAFREQFFYCFIFAFLLFSGHG